LLSERYPGRFGRKHVPDVTALNRLVQQLTSKTRSSFRWTSFRVQEFSKRPLLEFIVSGLQERGCRNVIHRGACEAPFFLAFDAPSGERQAILVYAFEANRVVTRNRPVDEHRF